MSLKGNWICRLAIEPWGEANQASRLRRGILIRACSGSMSIPIRCRQRSRFLRLRRRFSRHGSQEERDGARKQLIRFAFLLTPALAWIGGLCSRCVVLNHPTRLAPAGHQIRSMHSSMQSSTMPGWLRPLKLISERSFAACHSICGDFRQRRMRSTHF